MIMYYCCQEGGWALIMDDYGGVGGVKMPKLITLNM